MHKSMSLKEQGYLCAALCGLGSSVFLKSLMVSNFVHCYA